MDYILQRVFTSLLFTFPIFKLFKKTYFLLRFKTTKLNVTNNVVITNFDKYTQSSYIKFKGNCICSRNIEIDYSGGIEMGKNVTISNNVTIQTHKHIYEDCSLFNNKTTRSNLIIGDEVWICNNVTVTEKVNFIGRGAIIASGSVLTTNVEENSIVGGIPAKHIKFRKLDNE